jgi:hypothetical protein
MDETQKKIANLIEKRNDSFLLLKTPRMSVNEFFEIQNELIKTLYHLGNAAYCKSDRTVYRSLYGDELEEIHIAYEVETG